MKSLYPLMAFIAFASILLVPPEVFATDANNFIYGADGTQSVTGIKGSRTKVTIMSSTTHSFNYDNEDHNYHLEMQGSAAGSTWYYLVGYTVNEADPTKAHPWAEVFQAGIKKHDWSSSTTYTHGSERYFGIHKPGTTVSFYDTASGSSITSYNTGNTDSFNAGNIFALAEKICPINPSTCDAEALGDSPTIWWGIAMQYTSSSTYSSASWSAITSANMFYATKPSQSESSAQTEMCKPMTAKGNIQAPGTHADNQMSTFDDSLVTCTGYTINLWT